MKIDSRPEGDNDDTTNNDSPVFCPVPACTPELSITGFCDFKLFVSWIGSDKNNKKLISSSERFLIFKNYNLEKLFESVLEIKKEEINNEEIGK